MSFIKVRKSGRLTGTEANGDYLVSMQPGSLVIVEAAGTYAGASVALGYNTAEGEFMAYDIDGTPVVIADGEAHQVRVTGKGGVALRIANATGSTVIDYIVTPVLD